MNCSRWLLLCLLSSLSATASAQTVLVVDGLNRPGTNFTDLPLAEAAARDGDVISIRSDGGNYTAIQTQKALTIVADIGQAIISAGQTFSVSGIPAGKQFTMRGCLIGPRNTTGPVLQIANCAGRVVLTQIEVVLGVPSLEATACAGILLQESRILGGFPSVSARSCVLEFEQDQVAGGAADSRFQFLSAPAVDLQQCAATFAMCQLTGGLGDPTLPPAPAMTLANSTAEVGAAGAFGSLRAGAPGRGTGIAPAVAGASSTLRIDPLVLLVPTGSAPPTQGITVVVDRFPSLGASMFASHTLQLNFGGSPAATNILLVGLPAGPRSVPGVAGDLWIDPNAFAAQLGVPPTVTVLGLPHGFTIVAQVAGIATTGAVSLSNPAVLVAR
ncbi:MAG TPA: hypothetical protein VK348_11370 [Planctomycetota bacterium]|nr:hypothetical protein [Planctomycetota bacterium]